jgi:hypothetical protein
VFPTVAAAPIGVLAPLQMKTSAPALSPGAGLTVTDAEIELAQLVAVVVTVTV